MRTNAPHIGHDARMDISDCQPVDELASVRAWPRAPIVPALRVHLCLLQALREQVANNLIRKGLHATVSVMDDEPLACTEKLVADHKRANSIVARAAAGIPNHMGVAFGEAGELCRIEARVHASQNREAPRGRHAELTFSAEPFAVGAIGSQHLIKNSAHSWKLLFVIYFTTRRISSPRGNNGSQPLVPWLEMVSSIDRVVCHERARKTSGDLPSNLFASWLLD